MNRFRETEGPMNTRDKCNHFARTGEADRDCQNSQRLEMLSWKRCVLPATPACVFSADCLQDSIARMGDLEKQRPEYKLKQLLGHHHGI